MIRDELVTTVLARIGRRMFAVAVFDATSVMVAVIIQIINMVTNGGKEARPASCSPIQSDKPDAAVASDKANPPPVSCNFHRNCH